MTLRISLDLGGTKIEIVALDGEGRERVRRRAAIPRSDYAATVATLRALVRDTERELGATSSIRVDIPGALSTRTGLVGARRHQSSRDPPPERIWPPAPPARRSTGGGAL
jgi:fructokinase